MKDAPYRFQSSALPLDGSRDYIEEIYQQYKSDPSLVSDDWQTLFASLDADTSALATEHLEDEFWMGDQLFFVLLTPTVY